MDEILGPVGVGELGEGLGHPVEAEGVKLVEGGMLDCSSTVLRAKFLIARAKSRYAAGVALQNEGSA